jgi:glycerate-2-kinase
MDFKRAATDIFLAGVESVKPDNLIRRFVHLDTNVLRIRDLSYNLEEVQNIIVIGAGKASALMALEIEKILGNHISKGQIITKYHHGVPLRHIVVTEAGHPVPDENGIAGTEEILTLVKNASEKDLVICLISGGGSALLTDLPEGCSLEDLKMMNDVLLKSGATIKEMDCIRKHVSKIKGGQLSKAVWPSQLVSLILSDVIGDPLDVIASGPTAPDPTTFSDALFVLKKYNLEHKIPENLVKVLQNGANGIKEETPKKGSKFFSGTHNLIIGNNNLALESAKEKSVALGFETQIITSNLEGNPKDIVHYIGEMIRSIRELDIQKPVCLLIGGEPTLKVDGNGKGGRNQHLVLLAAEEFRGIPDITFLSAGTDGTDGPTDAAGAVIDTDEPTGSGLDKYLEKFDSYTYFKEHGGLIVTGPTQTNVMDIIIILIH